MTWWIWWTDMVDMIYTGFKLKVKSSGSNNSFSLDGETPFKFFTGSFWLLGEEEKENFNADGSTFGGRF